MPASLVVGGFVPFTGISEEGLVRAGIKQDIAGATSKKFYTFFPLINYLLFPQWRLMLEMFRGGCGKKRIYPGVLLTSPSGHMNEWVNGWDDNIRQTIMMLMTQHLGGPSYVS